MGETAQSAKEEVVTENHVEIGSVLKRSFAPVNRVFSGLTYLRGFRHK